MTFDGPQAPETPAQPPAPSSEERMWAMFCHLGALAGWLIPPANIIAPLVVWLLQKEQFPLVDDQGKEALNVQISVMIYAVISAVLVLVLIGIVLLAALAIFTVMVTVMGAIKANDGVAYRYPLCIRFIQ
jgi:uncharacterized Tic20 family protein